MRFCVAGVVLAACAEPPAVPLQLAVQPAAIAFRGDGDPTWSAVPEISHSERSAIYAVPDEDGTLAIACTWPDGTVQVEELLATAGEFGSAFYAQPEPWPPPPQSSPRLEGWPQLDCGPAAPPTALVAGNMIQGGEVYIGSAWFEGPSQWGFAGPVTAGVHDLVAKSGATVLVRHDQAMLSSYVEPVIDIAQGSGLDSQVLTDETGQPVDLETDLVTVNDTRLELDSLQLGSADVVPDSQLEPGDTQVVIATFSQISVGFFSLPLDGLHDLVGPTTNATIQFDQANLAADLSQLSLDRAASAVRLAYDDDGFEGDPPMPIELAATATPAWLALHGPRLAIDTSFPDFRWTINPNAIPEVFLFDRAPTAVRVTYVGGL